MKISKVFCLIGLMCFFIFLQVQCFGHEGHHEEEATVSEKQVEVVYSDKIIKWLGNFHPILLHFPIALITMAVVSELLFFRYRKQLFIQASRFMIVAAAVTAIPTALTGFAFSYGADYEGLQASYFWWHRFFGIFTTLLAIITAVFRELPSQKLPYFKAAYYLCLFLLFISVNVTGFFGGSLTFGIGHLWPPFL